MKPSGATSSISATGSKSFTLSMIETAIEVTEGKVPADIIQQIVNAGRDMLSHPIDLLPGVADTLEALAGKYTLVHHHQGRSV